MSNNRPVIFLDIDGVLCTNRSCVRQTGMMQILDPVATAMLEKLILEFKCQLVLSSSWRLHHDQIGMTAILQNAGLHQVPWHQNWKTCRNDFGPRGAEIKKWMEQSGFPRRYLILDDQTDMLPEQIPQFVQTDERNGFLWQHYEDSHSILKRNAEYPTEDVSK